MFVCFVVVYCINVCLCLVVLRVSGVCVCVGLGWEVLLQTFLSFFDC